METYKELYKQDCKTENENQHIPVIKNFKGIIYAFGDIHGDIYLVIQILLAIKVISFTNKNNIFNNNVTISNNPDIKKIYDKFYKKEIIDNDANINSVLNNSDIFRNYFYKHYDITKLKDKYFLRYIDNIKWTTDNVYVIQTGDIIDSFRPDTDYLRKFGDTPSDINTIMLFKHLNKISNGRMVNLLGNHEIMNIVNDYRYVSKNNLLNITDILSHIYIIHLINYIKKQSRYISFVLDYVEDNVQKEITNITDPEILTEIIKILNIINDDFSELKKDNFKVIEEMIISKDEKIKIVINNFLYITKYYNKITNEDTLRVLRELFFKRGGTFAKKMACFMYSTFMINDILFVHAGIVKNYLETLRHRQNIPKKRFYRIENRDNIMYLINTYIRRLIIYPTSRNNTDLIDEIFTETSPLTTRNEMTHFDNDKDLKLLNIGKMIVGHSILDDEIIEKDKFIIYLDVGMSNSMGRNSTGQILKIEDNGLSIITLKREP